MRMSLTASTSRRSDPATETLIHDYQVAVRTDATLRQALDVIAGMLPEEHKFCRAVPEALATHVGLASDWDDLDGDATWRAWIKALQTDPDARLDV